MPALASYDAPAPLVHGDAQGWAGALGYDPKIPPAWAVPVAASTLFDAANSAELCQARTAVEGPSWYVSVAPGSVRVGSVDHARQHRNWERESRRRQNRVREGATYRYKASEALAARVLWSAGLLDDIPMALLPAMDVEGHDPLAGAPGRREITEWSRKSRVNMIRRYSTLDFGPLLGEGVPAMVTLTLPGDWLRYAPTGRDFKRLVRAFAKRYHRAWGANLRGLWKLEFQDRGAPHLHVLMVPPTSTSDGLRWRDWFARAWADVLGVVGEERAAVIAVHSHRKASADYAEGLRATDPKRIAVYFGKHSTKAAGSKEYQHVVPSAWWGAGDGPGRFWGYWDLDRADRAVPITDAQAVDLARTLRRWQRAKRGVRRATVVRVDRRTGTIRARTVRRRIGGMPATRGFLLVNDGPVVAMMLAGRLRT